MCVCMGGGADKTGNSVKCLNSGMNAFLPFNVWARLFVRVSDHGCVTRFPDLLKHVCRTTPAGPPDRDRPARLWCDGAYQASSRCVRTDREKERITNQLTLHIFFQVTY